GLGDPQPLRHALRELAQPNAARVRESNPLEQFIHAASPLESGQCEKSSRVVQKLFGGQVIVKVWIFRKVPHAGVQGNVTRVAAQDAGCPRGRENEPEKG